MTVKTRYFVIVSLLVIFVGLGTGLVAYYVGFPTSAFFNHSGPEELRYMPSTAAVVGYVEVREIMASDLRQRLHKIAGSPAQDEGKREFQELTGINFETDIERLVACFDATEVSAGNSSSGIVLARGLFDIPGVGAVDAVKSGLGLRRIAVADDLLEILQARSVDHSEVAIL